VQTAFVDEPPRADGTPMNDDQILELLCERFPRTFARDPAERPPLKRGIDRDLGSP